MRIFKKKDGSPSGFAKILKGAAKVVGKVAPAVASVVPVPGAAALGKLLGKVTQKTGVDLSVAAPAPSENLGEYANRVLKGAGGALAGFSEQVEAAPELSSAGTIQPKAALTQGYAQNKYGKYMLFAGAAVGGFFLLKTLRIIK